MQLPEDLKNVHVNLDSETARQIAEQWIFYKYVDSSMAFICCMTFLLGLILGAAWLVKKMTQP